MEREVIKLILPNGEHTELLGDPADLSIFQAVLYQAGYWEPHLSEFFKKHVSPGWVCLDIGANIGCHTLGLASLAYRGVVWALEASLQNFAFLAANVAAMRGRHARIEVAQLAVWDSNEKIELSAIRQLGCCSFVSMSKSEAESESIIRSQVPQAIIGEMDLSISIEAVQATTLEAWALQNEIDRLDLVKMDIEGCERRVLAASREFFRRYNPILVTEYNPRCADLYWNDQPGIYFELLEDMFSEIYVINPDGLGEPISSWADMELALKRGPGWLDLYCKGVR